jgi:hypothetical protein
MPPATTAGRTWSMLDALIATAFRPGLGGSFATLLERAFARR